MSTFGATPMERLATRLPDWEKLSPRDPRLCEELQKFLEW